PNFGHCAALHADACESFLHLVEPVRLDDGLNAFHARLQRESKCHAPRRTSAPGQTGKKRTSWLISPNAGRLRLIDLAFCNVTAAPASLPGLEHHSSGSRRPSPTRYRTPISVSLIPGDESERVVKASRRLTVPASMTGGWWGAGARMPMASISGRMWTSLTTASSVSCSACSRNTSACRAAG